MSQNLAKKDPVELISQQNLYGTITILLTLLYPYPECIHSSYSIGKFKYTFGKETGKSCVILHK